jgi:hypothetical protein
MLFASGCQVLASLDPFLCFVTRWIRAMDVGDGSGADPIARSTGVLLGLARRSSRFHAARQARLVRRL